MPSAPTSSHELTTADFGAVEYIDRGEGPAVLVVHGSPGGCDQGSLMADFLVTAGFRAIIPSRPGYLRTPLTPLNARIDAQADSHASLMKSLGIDRFAILCWSGGGPSSYRLAVRHPDRVSALVAFAALSGSHVWDESLGERIVMHTRPGYWLIKAMARWSPKQLVSGTLDAEGNLTKAQLKELTHVVMTDETKRAFILGIAAMASQVPPRKAGVINDKKNFAAIADLALADIHAPTMLVHGDVDVDVDVTPDYSQRALAAIPNAQLMVMPEGGHVCFYTAPDSAAAQADVIEFLQRHCESPAE